MSAVAIGKPFHSSGGSRDVPRTYAVALFAGEKPRTGKEVALVWASSPEAASRLAEAIRPALEEALTPN